MTLYWLLSNLYKYRRYIWYNAWYSLRYRYAGTGMGILWNFINPLCEILIYTVVFSLLVSKGVRGNSYALYLTAGLLPWRTFISTIVEGGNAFIENAIYLKRLTIPPEVFVAKVALTSLFVFHIYMILLVPVNFFVGEQLGGKILFLPVIGLLLQGLAFGMALALANLQTLLPDIQQLCQAALPLWTWTMPILYLETIIPEHIRPWLYLNPPYAFIKAARDLVLENQMPSLQVGSVLTIWLFCFFWLGAKVNCKLQSEVRDAI